MSHERPVAAALDSRSCNMVLGYHLTFSTYGFWLPNDPRGSRSNYVHSSSLRRHGDVAGPPTPDERGAPESVAAWREAARRALKYPAVHFDSPQIESVAAGFEEYVKKSGVVVFACSILSEHVHFVIARHEYEIE